MKKRLGLPELEIAEKQGKAVYLKLMRDDVLTGKLCLLSGKCDGLTSEWSKLQWKDEKKLQEDPRCANHESDSCLYAWRETFAFAATEPDPIPDPTKPEYNQYLEKLYAEETQDNQEEFAYGTSETYSDW